MAWFDITRYHITRARIMALPRDVLKHDRASSNTICSAVLPLSSCHAMLYSVISHCVQHYRLFLSPYCDWPLARHAMMWRSVMLLNVMYCNECHTILCDIIWWRVSESIGYYGRLIRCYSLFSNYLTLNNSHCRLPSPLISWLTDWLTAWLFCNILDLCRSHNFVAWQFKEIIFDKSFLFFYFFIFLQIFFQLFI